MDCNNDLILQKKERVYRRNYVSILGDGLFFSFALTVFSTENVLPVYISNISQSTFYIALLSAMRYGLTYLCTVIACVIGTNAKSPKWASVWICMLQRVGFLMIYFSTFLVRVSPSLALGVFFLSFAAYCISAGMSTPLFSQMVGVSIYRNTGSFFGMYNVAGALGGLAASGAFAYFTKKYVFPLGFRYIFLLGVITALISSASVALGVREVIDDRVVERIRFRDILPIGVDIFRTNRPFRHFTLVRLLSGAAEFTVPYYILHAAELPGIPEPFIGTMTILFLSAKIAGSIATGKITDRCGAQATLRFSCMCCAVAALLAVTLSDYRVAYIMYVLLAVGTTGVSVANEAAVLEYSHNQHTTFYSAVIGVFCAPVSIITAFCGAAIAVRFSFKTLFTTALIIYLVCLCTSEAFRKK